MAMNLNITPQKQYTVLNIAPTTKFSLCILCGNTIVVTANRRKLWKFGVKTNTCKLLEDVLDIEFEQNEVSEVACRYCVDKFTTLSKKKSEHLQSLQKTKQFLKEKYGITREKRLSNVDSSSKSTKKSKASKSLFGKDTSNSETPDCPSKGVWVHCQYPSVGLNKKTGVAEKFQPLAKALMQNNEDHVVDMFLAADGILNKTVMKIAELINNELRLYSSTDRPSLLRYKDLDSLKQFTWSKFDTELKNRAPIFWNIMTLSSLPKAKHVQDSTMNKTGYLSAAAKVVSLHNSDMNVLKRINSVILKNGHTRKRAFKRLVKSHDCMSYTTANKMLVQFGDFFDKELLSWKEEAEKGTAKERKVMDEIFVAECDKIVLDPTSNAEFQKTQKLIDSLKLQLDNIRKELHHGYSFTGDNVDVIVNPRQMTISRQNKDHHLYQANAYKNRVSGNHLCDENAQQDIKAALYHTFLPSDEDDEKLISEFSMLISQAWIDYLPFLQSFKECVDTVIPHKYMKEMSTKTEKVRLGVWKKNEQRLEDMQELCKILHQYIPFHQTDESNDEENVENPVKCLSGGDYLTHERQKSAIELHADGRTPSKRLEGLISKMEDFHAQAEWQKVIWKHLHSTHSAKEMGTLYSCRNIIEARNVTKDPHENFYAASELLDKFTVAYLILGAFEHFGLQDIHSVPTRNIFNGVGSDNKAKQEYILQQAKDFVQKHVMPKTPVLSSAAPSLNSDLTCSVCGKHYQRPKALETHEKRIHGLGDTHGQEVSSQNNSDMKYNYTKTILSLCMMRMNHNDAIKYGDGAHVIRLYKYMYLYFKISNCPKYAYGFLETLAQVQCLLTPRLAHRLTWNRFVNTRGQNNTNFPMDLDIEHDNLLFKDNFFTFHGDVTNDSLTRASKSHFVVGEILHLFDKNTGTYKPSGKHTKINTQEDITKLVTKLKEEQLFVQSPGRFYSSFPNIQENLLNALDMSDCKNWMKKCFKKFSQKHYYIQ